ncbi:protein Spindly-like isoform X2 [Myxocyprinus asiaticus]|uniref:protein Spindly-like isoform X2 n=1 Tax=Myxocyprinus asiaticus TaxID=70543 RepID=UPI002222F784|nr:protein Spindly-like isoform X2 [Myxocyprinus asiaticus]
MSDLEDELKALRRKVQEGEEALQRAGQYGLQLLDDKMDLHNKLEEQRIEMSNVIEAVEQEKYSLQREVELKGRMLESLRSEFDIVKNHLKHQLEQQQTLLERSHALEISDLKNKVDKMKAELEEAQLAEKQMRHKLDQQSEALSSKTEELRVLTERAHETMSSEIMELQVQKMDMESAMGTLEQELQEVRYKEEQLHLANTTLQRQQERLTEEKEEREKEAVSCYNALEVEDKRAEMERQLNSMKRQHESLQKQHTLTKQHMHRMKMQIATLMQLQGNRADPAQLERLQFMLSEKNNEIETLMMKVRELEKVKVTVTDQHPPVQSQETELVDETYYTDLLKMQLSNSKKGSEKLKDELSMARMKALSESQRVLELERKLFGAEQALKQRHSENMKLQVKLEELQMKYTPNEVKKAQVQKRHREKFPVTVTEEKSVLSNEKTVMMDTEPAKTLSRNTEDKALSHPVKKPTVVPLQPAQTTEPNPVLPRESKSVRICEDPPVCIPDVPRSPFNNCNTKTGDQTHSSDEEENWRAEKKRKKYQQPTHVNSEKNMAGRSFAIIMSTMDYRVTEGHLSTLKLDHSILCPRGGAGTHLSPGGEGQVSVASTSETLNPRILSCGSLCMTPWRLTACGGSCYSPQSTHNLPSRRYSTSIKSQIIF